MMAKKLEQKPKGEGIPTTAKVSRPHGAGLGQDGDRPRKPPVHPRALGCW